MKKILLLLFVACSTLSFKKQANYFTGKIIYKYQFKDAQGKDITDAMAKVLGREQHYFISEKNYKVCDEENNTLQLYNSDSNTNYQIAKDKTAQKTDASIITSEIFTVTRLKTKEKIAGYNCSSIQVITDDATTTYFYNPAIKINSKVYIKHNLGEWNKVLKATGGALPLKFKMINHKQGFITWVSTAIDIKREVLSENIFNLPSDIKIKN
jgi:hypothetical protein